MLYEYSEKYVNPLSHDEVVHGKGSLLAKMPGDMWRQLANLRTLFAYQYTRPGKVLLFMGSELAPGHEWSHHAGLDWGLRQDPARAPFYRFVGELGRLYEENACLWRSDPDPEGFQWITCHDRENSVVAYARWLPKESEHLVVVLNLTPVPRQGYRLGAPCAGRYRTIFSTDDALFGGSGYAATLDVETDDEPWDGCSQSMVLTLPPLAALVLAPEPATAAGKEPRRADEAGPR
jgi:1,4-alpha-glucan branching enzyme